MQLGRVVGTCVATAKVESLRGHRLLVVQPLTFELQAKGPHVIAVDLVRAGRGELVFFVRSREAANACEDPFTPVDAACVGIVDDLGMIPVRQKGKKARARSSRAHETTADESTLVWLVRQGGTL